jgi:hypothetical protein
MTEFVVEADNGKTFAYSERSEAEEHAKKINRDFDVNAHVRVGGQTDGGEVIEEPNHTVETPEKQPQVNDLPDEPSVSSDPVEWLPSHFVDHIQGVPTVNRKGYAVIASKYGVSVTAEPVTLPGETDHKYAEFRAIAIDADGNEYSGFGSAHVDRMDGDDPYLLAELAETRAMKRATAWGTGIGMTAMSEMQREL